MCSKENKYRCIAVTTNLVGCSLGEGRQEGPTIHDPRRTMAIVIPLDTGGVLLRPLQGGRGEEKAVSQAHSCQLRAQDGVFVRSHNENSAVECK
jgi:hypothetical protein